MGVFSWVGTSCSHPRVCRLWGGGCLSCCLSFPHPVQTSFTPIAPSLCCRSRAATATTAPLCICQPLSLPQFPPPSTLSSCSLRFAARRGGSCQPHSPSTLLPSRPPKIPPLCPAGVWCTGAVVGAGTHRSVCEEGLLCRLWRVAGEPGQASAGPSWGGG